MDGRKSAKASKASVTTSPVGKTTNTKGLERGETKMERYDSKMMARFKKMLLEEKQRLLNNSKSTLDGEINISQDDLMDETDLAATSINQNLVFKLRDRERQLLVKIDEALGRMDEGSYGACEDCEEPIELRRLEARPATTLCIACKERQEHREKVYA